MTRLSKSIPRYENLGWLYRSQPARELCFDVPFFFFLTEATRYPRQAVELKLRHYSLESGAIAAPGACSPRFLSFSSCFFSLLRSFYLQPERGLPESALLPVSLLHGFRVRPKLSRWLYRWHPTSTPAPTSDPPAECAISYQTVSLRCTEFPTKSSCEVRNFLRLGRNNLWLPCCNKSGNARPDIGYQAMFGPTRSI